MNECKLQGKDYTAFQIPNVHMFGVVGIVYCRSRLNS